MNTAPKLHNIAKLAAALDAAGCEGVGMWTDEKMLQEAARLISALAPPSGEGVAAPLVQRLGMLVTMLRVEAAAGNRGYNFGEDAANRRSGRIADEIEQAIHEVRVLGKSHPQTAGEAELCRTTPQSVPADGEFVLVPREPTQAIRSAMYMAQHYDMSVQTPDEWGAVDKAYTAMLAAAPLHAGTTDDIQNALTVVNDAANDARHRGDYTRANALVRARVTLYRASTTPPPASQERGAECAWRCTAREFDDGGIAKVVKYARTKQDMVILRDQGYDCVQISAPPVVPDQQERSERSSRQRVVHDWCVAAFGEDHAKSIEQRGIRLVEEAIEAGQACGCDPAMVHRLVDHIYSKPAGALFQEMGGVGVTLLALAEAAGLDADNAEQTEIKRVLSKPLEHFSARNAAKNEAGFNVLASSPSSAAETMPAECCDHGRTMSDECHNFGCNRDAAEQAKPVADEFTIVMHPDYASEQFNALKHGDAADIGPIAAAAQISAELEAEHAQAGEVPELAELPDPVAELIDAAGALEAEEAGYCGDAEAREKVRQRLKQAEAAIRSRLAGGVTVDDEMVERAMEAYMLSRGSYLGDVPPDSDDMRAALVAALGARNG